MKTNNGLMEMDMKMKQQAFAWYIGDV